MTGAREFLRSRFPSLYHHGHALWHAVRAELETRLGSRFPELVWRIRGAAWARSYAVSTDHSHRKQLVAAIGKFSPVQDVLEVGCSAGANLVLLNESHPDARLVGVDISRGAIRVGRNSIRELKRKNIDLLVGRADQLQRFPSNSFDVVFCDAVLLLVGKDKIGTVIKQMAEIARKGMVFNEFHSDLPPPGNYLGGRWIYNFREIVEELLPRSRLSITKSDFVGGDWDQFGSLISVEF